MKRQAIKDFEEAMPEYIKDRHWYWLNLGNATGNELITWLMKFSQK
ncbi:hypothetical protein QW060_24885 [Myroides ceti]|uniref:Uncharacterized protein n=1 Tax=Paenimyroides ceti TaxID=395087 RepID=A0ABT8D454_9FLAO|nr:hypothetical protein [Paenimyroides ceti]MDN3710122.1 hypothetical protein [Paenimyroides ceti]